MINSYSNVIFILQLLQYKRILESWLIDLLSNGGCSISRDYLVLSLVVVSNYRLVSGESMVVGDVTDCEFHSYLIIQTEVLSYERI